MRNFAASYAKHFALNAGQALQGVRFLLTHPDVDATAAPGTLRHAALSLPLRVKRVANDLVFALLPPQWHHSAEELEALRRMPIGLWFEAGHAPYRFSEEGARLHPADVSLEPRWDPRCKPRSLLRRKSSDRPGPNVAKPPEDQSTASNAPGRFRTGRRRR